MIKTIKPSKGLLIAPSEMINIESALILNL